MHESINASGQLCIQLSNDASDFSIFAKRLTTLCDARVVEQLDGHEARYWDFEIENSIVVLHAETFAGVSIHSEQSGGDFLVRRLAERLLEA
jgi:hypothetical protein